MIYKTLNSLDNIVLNCVSCEL